jgi:hypothetical protein
MSDAELKDKYNFAVVDCHFDKNLCNHYNITAFPTIKMYVHPKEHLSKLSRDLFGKLNKYLCRLAGCKEYTFNNNLTAENVREFLNGDYVNSLIQPARPRELLFFGESDLEKALRKIEVGKQTANKENGKV